MIVIMRKYLFLTLLFISSLSLFSQEATNVRVRQEDKSIVITYDLSQKASVRVLMASGVSENYVELKAVSGDVGRGVLAGADREVVWKPLEEHARFIAKNVRFKVETMSGYKYYTRTSKVKTLMSYQMGYSFSPQWSYGAMIAQMYRGAGWYVNGRSNFHFDKHVLAGTCNNEQGYVNGERPFYSGKIYTSHMSICGGVIVNFLEKTAKNKFNTFGFYLGGGYGKRELLAATQDDGWIKYEPTSHSGVAANIGLFGSVYGVTINVGVSTIDLKKFKYLDLEAGIGFMF